MKPLCKTEAEASSFPPLTQELLLKDAPGAGGHCPLGQWTDEALTLDLYSYQEGKRQTTDKVRT
jgi:hypothetical protein